MVRELPILVKVPTFAPMPNMTYDGTKMMLRYGWPQPFREGSQHMVWHFRDLLICHSEQTEERVQIRLFERESILTIAQLLRPFFKSSPTGTAAPSRQSVSATQQRPRHTIGEQSLESAVKRQRILVSPEPIRANASNIRTRPLSRSNSPAYPSHTSHHKNDEDDDSTRTIRLNQETPYMATRAPWESDRVPSQSHRPAKPASPSLTTAVRDMQFETLHPTLAPILPKEVLTPLIDLQGESQEVLVPGITAPSWPNAATLNRCPSQTPSENDSNGGHVNFPPIPATSWSSVTNHNGTTEERAQSSRSLDAAASHFNASHHAVLGSSETKTLSPSAFAPNILPTVNAAYDWSDEQLEIQIDSILGERGFTHLVSKAWPTRSNGLRLSEWRKSWRVDPHINTSVCNIIARTHYTAIHPRVQEYMNDQM